MKVYSLVYENFQHHLIEVEVTLHPGLPGVQILGLPDPVVKDCVWRIKSAFLQTGYIWPTASQVIVNLKPSSFKKRGAGLDLAIAAAILWETGQSSCLQGGEGPPLLYGEIDLLGDVHTPIDFFHYIESKKHKVIVTGKLQKGLPFGSLSVPSLKYLAEAKVIPPLTENYQWKRPELSKFKLSKPLADIVSVVATGEHPTLFAGKAGSGKTSVVQIVHTLLEPPNPNLVQEYTRYHAHNPLDWRPLRNPHHTTSALGMIGGGANVQPGELTRAHGGTLILDEFLEFDPSVQEALREPMESGAIELIRCAKAQTLPARFMLLATTNLCKCGEFEPHELDAAVVKITKMRPSSHRCRCIHFRRRKYLERLSGPTLDRFGVVVFSSDWQGSKLVKVQDLLGKIEGAIAFRKEHRKVGLPNAYIAAADLKPQVESKIRNYFPEHEGVSERRIQHLLRVARSLADLEQKEQIGIDHLEFARQLTVSNFSRLKRATSDLVVGL